jgi:multiple sugar transport system permease protein
VISIVSSFSADKRDQSMRQLLLAPAYAALAFIIIIPVGFTVYASFTDWHLFNYGAAVNFVGLANFAKLIRDENFLISVRNTAYFATVAAPLEYVIGLAVAVALDSVTIGRRFFRILFWLPLMMGSVLVTLVVGRMMYDPLAGPLNEILGWFRIEPIPWLADRSIAMLSIILVDIWWSTAFIIMILLAGLQSLPDEVNDAARVDGATEWQLFWRVTFPLLAPVSATVILIRIVDAWKVLDIINVLTGGGPGRATQSITLLVYQLGVRGGDISYASTMAWMLTLIIAVVAGVVFVVTRRWVY